MPLNLVLLKHLHFCSVCLFTAQDESEDDIAMPQVHDCPINMQVPSNFTFHEIKWKEPTANDAESNPVNPQYKSHANPRLYVQVGGDPELVKYEFEDKDGNVAYCNFTISAVRKYIILYCFLMQGES